MRLMRGLAAIAGEWFMLNIERLRWLRARLPRGDPPAGAEG